MSNSIPLSSEFYFNNYNIIIKLTKLYISRSTLSIHEIIREEALKSLKSKSMINLWLKVEKI